ncbi:MAG TPA: CHAT domain-containing protein, partial [Acidimicrobiales bacterium]|nr:CHAT domain-containing protein [Acidimicrobiales bacterium]
APADVSAGEGDAAPQGAIDRPGPALSLPTAAPLPAGAGRPTGIAPVHPVRPLGPGAIGPRLEQVIGESSPAVTDEPVQGARFANLEIADAATREPLGEVPVQPGQRLMVSLDIGPLSEQSAVSSPVPFPDTLLPKRDLVIDVTVSSSHFLVSRLGEAGTGSDARQGSFALPADGSPARTPDGGRSLVFVLQAPPEPGMARARVTYFYAGAAVQSHLLEASVGGAEPLKATTDYTLATAPQDIVVIPERPRVTVLVNGDAGSHQVLVRRPAGPSQAAEDSTATAFDVEPGVGDFARSLRSAFGSDGNAPATLAQSKRQLVQSMRELAPLGWSLFSALLPELGEQFNFLDGSSDLVLQVARPKGSNLSIPWQWLYTLLIDSSYGPTYDKVRVCDLVANWDGRSPLVSNDALTCPHWQEAWHREDVLCPFGFLGFRHHVEQLCSSEKPVLRVTVPVGSDVVVAETAYDIDENALTAHVEALSGLVAGAVPGSKVEQARDKKTVREYLMADVPLVYFFCHGEHPVDFPEETWLGVGKAEYISPGDFNGWVNLARNAGHKIWDLVRPLVFINACHSAEIDDRALFNFVSSFVGWGNAAGVIGTEVRVNPALAMDFAQWFFERWLQPEVGAGEALRYARARFLAAGNLYGLVYTPYCWADLMFGPAGGNAPAAVAS